MKTRFLTSRPRKRKIQGFVKDSEQKKNKTKGEKRQSFTGFKTWILTLF